MTWNLNASLPAIVGSECGIDIGTADKLMELYEDGNEVAYVARYRGDAHKGLSCPVLRSTFETYLKIKDLNKKVEKALQTVQSKINNDNERKYAVQRLREARDVKDVSEITQALMSGRKTKADKARELGLSKVADAILDKLHISVVKYVDKKNPELADIEKVNEHLVYCLSDAINRLPETIDYGKDISSLKNPSARISVRCELSNKAKKWTENDREFHLIKHFEAYTDFKRDASRVQGYQILAMERGDEKGALSWKIEIGSDLKRSHPASKIRVLPEHVQLFNTALDDSINRLLIPKIQRSIKRLLKSQAEAEAIACFSANLVQLFAQEGLSDNYVIALDPGFGACKSAYLTDTGAVIETTEFHLRGTMFDKKGQDTLMRWVKVCKHKVVVAIGNGTASTETQKAVAEMIRKRQFGSKDIRFCVVTENGASKYSITPLAETELPNMPITQKSAVSIGRRLLNPMAEYVKIEPKHLGLGMYQHSVNEKKLSDILELVVRECVSLRGVNINSASFHLLQQICGLNKKTSEGIVAYRNKNGHFTSRFQLKDIPGLGPKSFEQCAGFLTISPPNDSSESKVSNAKRRKLDYNPLDGTTVHPMHYDVAKKLLKRCNINLENSISLSPKQISDLKSFQNPSSDEQLVIELLTEPSKTIPPPPLLTEVRSTSSLQIGETMFGRVQNQVAFGVFVDIGAECNALAHKSSLTEPFPEVGTQLLVKIVSVDVPRKRINISPVSVEKGESIERMSQSSLPRLYDSFRIHDSPIVNLQKPRNKQRHDNSSGCTCS